MSPVSIPIQFLFAALATLPSIFYFENLYNSLFHEYLLLSGLLAGPYFIIKRIAHKKLVGSLLIGFAAYLLFISLPPVKLIGYHAPVYPLACLALGFMIIGLGKAGLNGTRPWHFAALATTVVIVVITIKNSFLRVEKELGTEPHIEYVHQTIPDAVRILHDRYPDVCHFAVLLPPITPRYAHALDELTFYKRAYEHDEHKEVSVTDRLADYNAGDTVICSREILTIVEKQHEVKRLDSTEAGAMWVVLGIRMK